MKDINHLFIHFRRYGWAHRNLYIASLMLFFWAIFDAIIAFVAPLVITQSGISASVMGLILGFSSLAGAVFDIVLARFLGSNHFRKVYLLAFALCFAVPVVLSQAKTIPLFMVAMALWGFYYDLVSYGEFDFIGRQTAPEEHISSFGVMDVFRALGYLIGPLIAGLLIVTLVELKVFVFAIGFLGVAFIFYLILAKFTRRAKEYMKESSYKHKNFALEIRIWKRLGKAILPILIFTVLINVYDSFFWSVGPLFSESLSNIHPYGGLFMSFYILPSLVVGWFVGSIVGKANKGKAAFLYAGVAGLILILLPVIQSFPLILLAVFASSGLTAVSYTTIKATYVDMITKDVKDEKEIESLGDLSTNLGYVFGPILAGFLADFVGYSNTFAILGVVVALVSLVLASGRKPNKVQPYS